MNTRSRRIGIRHPRRQEPIVWIVDSEQWPRACLRAELIERGYDPCGFVNIGDALESLSGGMGVKPKALVLELRGQNLTAPVIETIRNLKIPTILLGGDSELNDPLIKQYPWENLLKRPFSLGTIADLIQKIVPANARARA